MAGIYRIVGIWSQIDMGLPHRHLVHIGMGKFADGVQNGYGE